MLILANIYIFILATALAILEIQIEGQHGWAKNLPTWRPHNSKWFSKLYTKIMSGRELTGYHLTMFTFVLLIFFFPFVSGRAINLENILKSLSFFFMFIVLWDFLWFVLNPFYPLKNFKGTHIWWHKKWILGLPRDYYGGVIVSLLILIPLFLGNQPVEILRWWGLNILLFILQTLILIIFSMHILKIDNWTNKPS